MRVKRCDTAAMTGRTRSMSASRPPAMIASVPCSAPGTPPDTGASIQPMPQACSSREAMSRQASGAMLEKSTTSLPAAPPCATPSLPNTTISAARWSVTHIMTMSTTRAIAAGDSTAVAPCATSGASFSRLRFQTATR